MDVAVVGAGRVGSAFSSLLSRAGYGVVNDPAAAEVVFVTTPDDRIEEACADLANRGLLHQGQFVAHASGAVGLAALASAEQAGARILSLHPLQTFPDADSAAEGLPGSAMAVTASSDDAFELGERIARDLGARPFRLADELKPIYHAAAVFSSNYVVTILAIAEELFRRAGLEDPLPLAMPLVRAVIDAVERLGPAEALTGPAVRGDAGTLEANLRAMGERAPEFVTAYETLALAAVDLATRSGRLSNEGRTAVEEVLARWT